MQTTPRNFVIYSLPRCASTSLAKALNLISEGCCLYEPFTPGRYKNHFVNTASLFGIKAAVDEVFKLGKGFKHIWNPTGWPFDSDGRGNNSLLLEPQTRIVLLTRRNMLKRIVSEQIAQQSKAWRITSSHAADARRRFPFVELPVAIVNRILVDEVEAIRNAIELLGNSNKAWLAVTFEELTSENIQERVHTLRRLFRFLRVDCDEFLLNIVNENGHLFRPSSEVKSDSCYRFVPNLESIEAKLGNPATGFLFR